MKDDMSKQNNDHTYDDCYFDEVPEYQFTPLERKFFEMEEDMNDGDKKLKYIALQNILTIRCLMVQNILPDMLYRDDKHLRGYLHLLNNHMKVIRFFVSRLDK